jgi:hypothetical protein
LVEIAMRRYKVVIGRAPGLCLLGRPKRKIGCKALNVMTGLGMRISYRIA